MKIPPPKEIPSPDVLQKIQAEQVKQLYQNASLGMAATVINSAVLSYVEWNLVSHKATLIWLCCLLTLTLLRSLHIYSYSKKGPIPPAETARWRNWFVAGMALSGVTWGAAGIFLYPVSSTAHQVLLFFVLGGMVAGAAGTYSIVMGAFLAYGIPALTPLVIRSFSSADEVHVAMGGMMVLFGVLLYGTAKRVHVNAVTSLGFRFENSDLISRLASEKERAEELNEKLLAEIAERRKTQEELQKHRDDLEDQVDRRTFELSSANARLRKEIAARKEAEETLKAAVATAREERNKSEAIVAAIGDGLIIIDNEYTVVYQNDAVLDMVGSLVGHVCYKAGEKRETPCENCPVELTFKDGRVHHVERTRTAQSGTIHMDITSSPLWDASGRIIAVIEIVRDITKKKEAEVVLERSRNELEILVDERTAELKMMNEQLRGLSSHLEDARENERTRIAREIHDDLGQSLTALNMDLSILRKKLSKDDASATEKAESMARLIEETIESVKRISTDLRPGILDHLGLTAALEWQAQDFERRTGVRCMIAFEPKEIAVDKDRSTTLFRIFQETLTNVSRHANAATVSLLLKAAADGLTLTITDDGRGITESQAADPKSLGLIGMRERVHYWGGRLLISGAPGKGTTVSVRLPLNGNSGLS